MTLTADSPLVWEQGDKTFVVSKLVQSFTPSEGEMEELAFATQVKKTAPNEHIRWLRGQYVEADRPNRNNAHWTASELALKSLTPMLMPVTVMHDPRTAVGTIADVKLLTPEKDGVQRARIDNVLALWAHRFPDVVEEADANLKAGTLMESMEAYTPAYECSACSQVFYKQAGGGERAQWCEHLVRGAEMSSRGYVPTDPQELQTVGWRTLVDVCFTGTGLIFGTQGAVGAYDEARLSDFQDEVAEYHQRVHTDTARAARSHQMGLVQIEESELKVLREERDEARKRSDDEQSARQEAEHKVEETETKLRGAESERDSAKGEVASLKAKADEAKLAEKRLGALGDGFKEKLGEFTRARLSEQASTHTDEEWENRIKELEEMASVKRDAGATKPKDEPSTNGGPVFSEEEIAKLKGLGGDGRPESFGDGQSGPERRSVASGLAKAFKK